MSTVTWVLESDVFPESHAPIREAVARAGHKIVEWSDDWIADGGNTNLEKVMRLSKVASGSTRSIDQVSGMWKSLLSSGS